MALILPTENAQGMRAEAAYWRLNNFDQLANRQPDGSISVPAIVRFRAYVSQSAFKEGKQFLDERLVSFLPEYDSDLRRQAYVALKTEAEFFAAIDA